MIQTLKEIINGEFINTTYNGDIYVLVDEFPLNAGKNIYYFNSLDKELFCFKENGGYVIVDDEELIDKVKEDNDLVDDREYLYSRFISVANGANRVEICDELEKEEIISRVLKDFAKVTDMPLDEIRAKLEKVKFKITEHFKNGMNAACYHPATNSIMFNSNSKSDLLFHECIHATGGPGYLLEQKISTGLMEGATECTKKRAYDRNKSGRYNGFFYNFDVTSGIYIENVAIIEQLEYILNEKVNDSIINGDTKFFTKFYRKYGINTYIYTKYLINKITASHVSFKNSLSSIELMEKLQTVLLKNVFDREFKEVHDKESTINYFKRLNGFGSVRARGDNEDSKLKNYYENKLNQLEKLNIGVKKEDIPGYEPAVFKPVFDPKDITHAINSDFKVFLKSKQDYYDESSSLTIYRYYKDDITYAVFCIDNEIVMAKEYSVYGSKRFNDIESLNGLKNDIIEFKNDKEKIKSR